LRSFLCVSPNKPTNLDEVIYEASLDVKNFLNTPRP
jgi:hypothetical protein